MMNIKEIKEILNLMREHGIAEIELEKEGMKLRLTKNGGSQIVSASPEGSAPVVMPAAAPGPEKAAAPQPGAAGSSGGAQGGQFVRSPMVGTFYAAPAPDQPSYVSTGQSVKEGDVLCIIEAMKLMNEIKAEVSGVIEEILVKNGDAIEFDQPLFRIKTA